MLVIDMFVIDAGMFVIDMFVIDAGMFVMLVTDEIAPLPYVFQQKLCSVSW